MENSDYAIIVPTFNKSELTIQCLQSIVKNTQNFYIVWVDDASQEEEFEAVRLYCDGVGVPCVALRNETNQGFIKSVNRALQWVLENSTSPYIIIQNNDTIVEKGWAEGMRYVLEQEPSVGIVGPVSNGGKQKLRYIYDNYVSQEQKNKVENISLANDINQFFDRVDQDDYVHIYSRVAFFSTLFRREVIEDIGLLSEEYGIGFWDDDDYCERALRSGWDVAIALSVFVDHVRSASFKEVFKTKEQIRVRAEHEASNQRIFEEKFGYGIHEPQEVKDIIQREMMIRLWRKSVENRVNLKRIHDMENSHFWKLRSRYLCIKKCFPWK